MNDRDKNPRMTEQLVCSYANEDQQLAAYRNVHEFWSGGRSLEEHLKWRLASPQHNRAKWCVGCLDGQVVTSLGCYPLQLHWDGEIIAGILIGAVHTLPAFRGRGYAPRLLSWVEEQQRQQGVRVSGLFSDIDPNYYGRLGYERCDSWEVRIRVDCRSGPVASRWVLQPIDPHEQLTKLCSWYEASQDSLPLWIARDDDYWQYLLARSASDQFFVLTDQQQHGYLRLREVETSWSIQDWGLAAANEEGLAAMLDAILEKAAQQGVKSIVGWLPPLERSLESVAFEPRPQEITMFKSLDPQSQVQAGIVQSAGYLREIDHV